MVEVESLRSHKKRDDFAVLFGRFGLTLHSLSWLIFHVGLVLLGHVELTVKNELGDLPGPTIHTKRGQALD